MYQLEGLIGPQRPQCLDHAKADPAAAMHGDPGGLVDDQQPVVFINDGLADSLGEARGGPADLGGGGVIRTGGMRILSFSCKAGLGARALAVYAHFALADDAEDAAARHAAQRF